MKHLTFMFCIKYLSAINMVSLAQDGNKTPYAPNVEAENWGHQRPCPSCTESSPVLGTWAHANTRQPHGHGVHEYHVVYTQPETLGCDKKRGRFPDGAVLVKELLRCRGRCR